MKRSEQFSDIREIADDVCSNSVTESQLQELEQKLKNNPEAKRFYFDYLRVHNGLNASADRNMEIVYRRMTEEVVIRPQTDVGIDDVNQVSPVADSSKQSLSHNKWFAIITTFALLAGILFWLFYNQIKPSFHAKILHGQIALIGQGNFDNNAVYTGKYNIIIDTALELDNGDVFELSAGSKVKFFTNTEIKLQAGKLRIIAKSGNNITVHGHNYLLRSNGEALSLDLTNKQPIVTSANHTTLNVERWRPKHYWSFDGETDRVINTAGSAHGVPAAAAKRVTGLLGEGAFYFDNGANARIAVGTGGGTAPATGSFSVTDGITLEVLTKPNYSGLKSDQDHIFSKGYQEGDLRIMLAFQHTDKNEYTMPQVEANESLSFGLYLVGQGYHELKLPLDGKNGRPTLAQLNNGSVYHIVASYDVKSGLKAIYINGIMLAYYHYPRGTKVLTGGPAEAMIGNNPDKKRWDEFAFSGTIDELAFYDFSLPALMVENHFQQVQQGVNYFGLKPNAEPLPKHVKIFLPPMSTLSLEPLTGLPAQILD